MAKAVRTEFDFDSDPYIYVEAANDTAVRHFLEVSRECTVEVAEDRKSRSPSLTVFRVHRSHLEEYKRKMVGQPYPIPKIYAIGRGSNAAEKLYKLEERRNQAIKAAAEQLAIVLNEEINPEQPLDPNKDLYSVLIPEQLASTLESYDHKSSVAACIAYLRYHTRGHRPKYGVVEMSLLTTIKEALQNPGQYANALVKLGDRLGRYIEAEEFPIETIDPDNP
jgi:hypothetical protein